MDRTTFVVSPATLIDGIHEIKQWVYNGQLRILVPLCTLQQLEQRYQASLVVKEQPKDTTLKKVSGRQARREQPLFDINPRTAWEFISRARASITDGGLLFQKEGEEFTQWKEDEAEEKAKTPPAPPTSFLEALQSRISNKIAPDMATANGPSKPKLVSRTNEAKSPWKLSRVPQVDSTLVPKELRPLFSCVLWRINEADSSHIPHTKYAVLADEPTIKAVAASLNITVNTRVDIRAALAAQALATDHREQDGQLEKDFPDAIRVPKPVRQKSVKPAAGPGDLQPSGLKLSGENGNDDKPTISNGMNLTNGSAHTITHDAMPKADDTNPLDTLLETLTQTTFLPPAKEHTKFQPFESLTASINAQTILGDRKYPPLSADSNPSTSEREMIDSDSESEEDVIVFNPRAKRMSGRPQTPAKNVDIGRSRPGTAEGLSATRAETSRLAKSPIISTLKPQSPVFTPGQIYVPTADITQLASSSPPTQTNGNLPNPTKSPSRSPKNHAAKTSPTKAAGSASSNRGQGSEQLRRQQSEMIIKRQREAINRQTKATTKAPPRQVQMEPTDNPTIIDPDAFDRSYVVQPPTQTPGKGSRRRHGGGKRRHSPKENSRQQGRGGGEPGDDFVLKSGTPRGASRGRGKLWVP